MTTTSAGLPDSVRRDASRRRSVAASHRQSAVLAAVGLAAATAGVDVMDPARRNVPLCVFHAATGWWCPLCGGLRAAQALSHGNVTAAVHDNVLVVAALPILTVLWLAWVVRAGDPLPARLRSRWVRTVVILALVGFTIVRNLPASAVLRP